METTDYFQEWWIKNKDARTVRPYQSSGTAAWYLFCLITLIICFHVSRVSRVFSCTQKSQNTQNCESLCSRSIRLKVHANYSYASRKDAKRRKVYSSHLSTFNVHLRTSEPQNEPSPQNSHLLSFNVHLSSFSFP